MWNLCTFRLIWRFCFDDISVTDTIDDVDEDVADEFDDDKNFNFVD